MLQISIDASNFIESSALSPDDINGFHDLLLDRLKEGFENEWTNQINENLHSTRNEYLKGIYVERPDDNSIVIGVTARQSKLAVNLELGQDAFDEKIGFQMSPKKTMKKDGKGWFITIPFHHNTPNSLGESAVFAGAMPVSVYKIVKTATKPLTLAQLPADQQVKGIRAGFNSAGRSFQAYTHKSAKFEGLVKVPNKDENRSGYLTFRRVSDLSDKNAFIHPGFLPRNLLGKALAKTDIASIIRKSKIEFFST
jgi:hypothetical protein